MAKKDPQQKKIRFSTAMSRGVQQECDIAYQQMGMPSRSVFIESACKLMLKHFNAGSLTITPAGMDIVQNPVLERAAGPIPWVPHPQA